MSAPRAAGPAASAGATGDPTATRHVVVVGVGGNIGSHLVPHLGRMRDVARVTLVDRGVYEAANLAGQDIARGDVGHAKAVIMGRRLRRIAPGLAVEVLVAAVEDVPIARLRADAIVAALDSRAARQVVNDVAWSLGVPWIDTGVAGEELLARVNVYLPGPDGPCLECAWDERDYAALEIVYPCGGDREPPASRAPSSLGALAASLGAIELRKLLDGDRQHAAVGRQVTFDATHHRLVVTRLTRRAGCRRAPHDPWVIARRTVPRRTSLATLGMHAPDFIQWLAVEGRRFQWRSICTRCVRPRAGLSLHDARGAGRCRRCGGPLVVAGFDLLDRLDLRRLGRQALQRTLASLGVRPGDMIRLEGPRESCRYEVSA